MASKKWAGFTDEDIERIKTNPIAPSIVNNNNILGERDNTLEKSKGPMKIKELAANTLQHKEFLSDTSKDETSDSDTDVKRKPPRLKKNCKPKEVTGSTNNINDNADQNASWENNGIDLSDDSCISSDTSKIEENCNGKSSEINSNFIELEEFEFRQKLVEAENARRRALISKAINDKKMQTLAEAVKLAKITQELDRLDSILSADVSILRDYIEKASLEFSEAEKRYLKAEKEFIDSKLHLFEKMQRKEQLTEHLCAIIEQNENRKANKLVELMKQLEMEGVIEDLEVNSIQQPILSKYCVLNDEAYHCCQTLKPSYPKAALDTTTPAQNVLEDTPLGSVKQSDESLNMKEDLSTGAEKSS